MTASLPPVQPASPQPASAAPSASDSAAPETPFSQVLSGELAQQRGRTAEPSDSDTEPAAAAAAADAAPAAPAPADWLPGALAEVNAAATATPAADTLLALALNPELQKPVQPRSDAGSEWAHDASAPSPGLSPLGPDSADRRAARAARAEAYNGRADAAKPATDTAGDTVVRNAAADPAALAARTDSARSVERLPDFMAALSHAQTVQASRAAAPLQAGERLSPQLGTPAWSQALGEKIVWMAAGSQQSATLTLNPPDLGPLQVVLNVSNDHASAHFFAAQPEVRQALEAALPRLRDMMQDAGIQLGQANVSADTARQQDDSPRDTPRSLPGLAHAGAESMADASLVAPPVRAGRGLVDTFA